MYYHTWFPGEEGYKEHLDRRRNSNEQVAAIKELQNELKKNGNLYSEHSEKIIASHEQIITALENNANRLSYITENGFNQISSDLRNLSEITERGLENVVSSIQSLNSDMNFYLGCVIQQIESTNKLLNQILTTLQEPIETLVKEQYNKGWIYIQKGDIDRAVKYLKDSISLKNGEDFFYSHYQLGRLYLNGVSDKSNIVNPKIANEYLLEANELGDGEIKINKSFIPILADCKLYLSQSFYYQLKGNNNNFELELIKKAIKYCEESVNLNPNLSQAFYHCAKYISYAITNFTEFQNSKSYQNLLNYFEKSVLLDRNYLRSLIPFDVFYDKVFIANKSILLKSVISLTERKKNEAQEILTTKLREITLLENFGVTESDAKDFVHAKQIAIDAQKDFNTETYFGFYDCIIRLEKL